jgi:hypothetical protein
MVCESVKGIELAHASTSTNYGKFLGHLCDHQLLKKAYVL